MSTSIANNFESTCQINGTTYYVAGTITISASSTGNAIISFLPVSPYPAGSTIIFTIYGGTNGFQDDGGNTFTGNVVISFSSTGSSGTSFDLANEGFESGLSGISFLGDGDITTSNDNLTPIEGTNYAAISTGEYLISSSSVNFSTSSLTIGPIDTAFTSLTFSYNLLSEEFNEFVGSQYDDNISVTISGPNGSITRIVDSVNLSGNQALPTIAFGLYGACIKGWTTYNIPNIDVGTPANITFSVTDVGDTAFSSIAAFDNLIIQ